MLGQAVQRGHVRAAVFLLVALSLVVTLLTPARAETGAATDVRILIDISGSMRDTDPRNRRTPAINLLIDAIPANANAGIWSFGRDVNLLVAHDPVTARWRDQARQRVAALEAIAQRTNLGAALDDAAYDFGYSTYQPPTDVILITDGQVDIAPNVSVNRVERDRILDTVIPRFAAAGARIHTLALGDAADAGLLEQMAYQTGGVFAEVTEPEQMQSFIVRVLSNVSPGNELPFDGRQFTVDSQVTELTALVMHDTGQIELRQPDGTINSLTSPGSQRWLQGQGYSLITTTDPMAGRWDVLGDINEDSRIQVVSDVNLYWMHPAGNVVLQDQPLNIELGVADANADAVPEELTAIMIPQLRINGELADGLRWDGRQLKAQVPNLFGGSTIELEVTVDAGTFQRQIRKTVVNRPALLSEVLVTDQGVQWRLYPASRDLIFEQTNLRVSIDGPANSERALQSHPTGYFFLDLAADMPAGQYLLTLTGDAQINGRPVARFGVAPVELNLPVAAGTPRILNPDAMPAAEPAPASEPAFVKEPMPVFDELSVQTPVNNPAAVPEVIPPPPVETEPVSWLRYALFSLPGLLILGAFFMIYRRLDQRSKGETEDLLAEDEGLADEALNELGGPDITADFDEQSLDEASDEDSGSADYDATEDAPLVDDVFDNDDEPSPPVQTEAPRVSMEDSLDTRSLDQDVWGELNGEENPNDGLDAEDDDLFDISNLEDGLSDPENLNLDEDDSDQKTEDETPKR